MSHVVVTPIRGIPVSFPFPPYQVQTVLMERVIEALQTNSNALLESPTGTGKTLSLLCASRAWQTQAIRDAAAGTSGIARPLIIYASRTHLQLEQVAAELNKTAYAGTSITMSSRENACSHVAISKLRAGEQIAACKQVVLAKQCVHRTRAQILAKKHGQAAASVVDVEDISTGMAAAAGEAKCCAYYYARDVLSNYNNNSSGAGVDICFMPYNYLVDPVARRGLNVPWQNSIVIIDEAHNIGDVCEEAYSFTLNKTHMVGAIAELEQLMRAFQKHPPVNTDMLSSPDLSRLKFLLKQLELGFSQCDASATAAAGDRRSTSEHLFPIFAAQGITHSTCVTLLTKLDMCIDGLAQCKISSRHLDHVNKCFNKVFGQQQGEQQQRAVLDTFYRFVSERENGWQVNLWCFSASVAFQDLTQIGVRTIILASGTLSPLDAFAHTLRIPFPIRLESPHVVVAKERVFLACLSSGVTGVKLNGSYQRRNDAGYYLELGNTLVALARVIPDGVLVFFSSYSVLQTCISAWKSGDVWDRLLKLKEALVVEQRGGSGGGEDGGREYDSALSTGGGAMMFAVCRGKASEGMDFRDKRARGVIVIGLPFPSSQDLRVVHKRAYLDAVQQPSLSGSAWYSQQACRAVNQAIGRAIRHDKDFGAILLLDERFATFSNQLSMWLRPCFQHLDQGPKQAIPQLVQFFKRFKQQQHEEQPAATAQIIPRRPAVRAAAAAAVLPPNPSPAKAPRLLSPQPPQPQPQQSLERRTATASEKESGAKFCNDCRKQFSQTQYQEFKLLLRNYHDYAEARAPIELNARTIALFGTIADRGKRIDLLQRLCGFLPARLQSALQRQIKDAGVV